jgi:uncharacterized membrane protein YeaQ/YmgE (transglycosylase-associated protein family)
MALYSERGLNLLLWNVPFGIVGAALCALALSWTGPKLQAFGLFTAVPLSAVLMIFAGQAIRGALRSKQSQTRQAQDQRAAGSPEKPTPPSRDELG